MADSQPLPRPSIEQLTAAYGYMFRSSVSLSKLRDAAFNGRLFARTADLDQGVVGRSMTWKLFLVPTEPLTPPASEPSIRPPFESLRALRQEYVELLQDKMRAPDGSYDDGFSIPGMPVLPRRTTKAVANLDRNNPLSLDENNPWRAWFTAVDLRNTIKQDVERTFPDIPYFRNTEVQSHLTVALYIYSVTHPDIGYRQGMHELLAPILYALDYDSISEDTACDGQLKEFCSRTWLAADAWALFGAIMRGVGAWYEWREPVRPSLPTPLNAQFHHGAPEGQLEYKAYAAPIVQTCQDLQTNLLKAADPILWQSMESGGIEPQIYGIRWLRLLFTREFSLPDAMVIWDCLFACDCTFELAPWICVAMLIRIRNHLIPADYSEQLTFLLRYPAPPKDVDPTSPHHIVLLVRQALALQISPNPSTGAAVVVENRNLLNIPMEVPTPAPRRSRRQLKGATRPKSASNVDASVNSSSGAATGFHRHQKEESGSQSQSQMSLPELFARGLLEKGESLGINRTVMNAVSELRKNIPELANHLIRPPATGLSSYSSFPMVDERPPEERPPWEPKTRFEIEKEMSELRTLQKRLGDAVGCAVDSLLQDEKDERNLDKLKAIQERKREAIECLAYARDILGGFVHDVEDERLFGEEGNRRRKLKAQQEKEAADSFASLQSPTLAPVSLPQPAAPGPTSPNDRQSRSALPSQEPQHPLSSLPRTIQVSQVVPATYATSLPHRATTLPRRGSSPSSSAAASLPAFAPWNYTPSSFSTVAMNASTLPRLPPKTSTALPNKRAAILSPPPSTVIKVDRTVAPDQAPRQHEVRHDPLGALP